jgi:hypothetical protein
MRLHVRSSCRATGAARRSRAHPEALSEVGPSLTRNESQGDHGVVAGRPVAKKKPRTAAICGTIHEQLPPDSGALALGGVQVRCETLSR